jgi:hypothetical protein
MPRYSVVVYSLGLVEHVVGPFENKEEAAAYAGGYLEESDCLVQLSIVELYHPDGF